MAFLTILPATPASAARKDLSGIKIVIDPGHGGKDSGALGPSGLRESNTALSISKHLRNYLTKAGAKVIMTREDDRFIPLPERANIANRAKAQRFVSVHLNSAANRGANRTETYFHKPAAAKMAGRIQGNMIGKLGFANGGSKTADFAVIKRTNMPGILTESAFISNPRVEAKLKTDSFKRKTAQAIYKGIMADYGVKIPGPAPVKPVKKQTPVTAIKPVVKPNPVAAKKAITKTFTKTPVKKVETKTPVVVKTKQEKSLLSKTVESIFNNMLPPVEKKATTAKPVVKVEPKPVAKPEKQERKIEESQHGKTLQLEVKNMSASPFLNPVTKAGNATRLEAPIMSPVLDKPVVIKNTSDRSIQPQVKFYNTNGDKVADIKPVLLKHKGLKIHPSNVIGSEFTGSMQITAPSAQIKTENTTTIMP